MRVGEARAAKIGHRVHFAPDDIVQDPEALILQNRPNAEDIMIAANHPKRAVGLEDAACLGQPGATKRVIGGKAIKLVPIIIDGIHTPAFGTEKITAELKIIGRIGKDHVDARIRKRTHGGNTIANDDLVQRQLHCLRIADPDLLQNPHAIAPLMHKRPV